MVFIPTGQREVGTPGGNVLPSPSGQRVRIAGAESGAVAELGGALAEVGFIAQKANDNAQFKTESINAESKLSAGLAGINQRNLDPNLYQAEATKFLDEFIKDSANNVGFRNQQRFGNVLNRLNANARVSISKEMFGKVADKSKAAHTLLKDTVAEGVATGKLSQAEGIAIVGQSTDELAINGIFDQENVVEEDRTFAGRVAEVAFESRFPNDPTGAINELRLNPNVTVEVKQNLIDKEIRKFNLVDKQKKEARRLDRIKRVKAFKVKARRGEASEDELLLDAKENPDNPMSVDEFTSVLNEINKVKIAGGVGNPDKFNEMMRNIKRQPNLYSINDIYDFEDINDLNADESNELEARWEKLTTGRSDPNDITTFRKFDDGIKFTNLFAPSRFDVGSQLGVKKLRFDQAHGFATGKAIELFKTNKDVDSVMAQVEFDTLKHMQEYDQLVQQFIDEGILEEGETSIFEVKTAVEPILKEREEFSKTSESLKGKITGPITVSPEESANIDAQLDEIEAIFDKAEAENRELTEAEIQKINEIQEAE